MTWVNWADWTKYNGEPNGGLSENCAMMLKQYQEHISGHSPDVWGDVPCSEWISDMSVVCQKREGCL